MTFKSGSKTVLAVLLGALLHTGLEAQTSQPGTTQAPAGHGPKYDSNPAAGGFFSHDGIKLYYEVYGTGEPLLLIHGNGGSISSFKAEIDYFRTHYKVIAMDSRDQGKSGDSPDKITYEKMTGDLAALLDYLHIGPVNVLGWSDGGIEALELGIYYPAKVKMIASMAANLDPEGVTPEAMALFKALPSYFPAGYMDTAEGKREAKVSQMMFDEPHIPLVALEKITAPTLIMASDHDLIRDDHTLAIYHHIQNGELAIFPNATHMIPYDDPALFDATVDRFFTTPYVKKDRIKDLMKSGMAMQAEQNQP